MPNIRNGKRFPNLTSANAAINAAENTWDPLPYTRGSFPGATDEQIGPQKLAVPYETDDGDFIVIDADHPALQGTDIDIERRKRPIDLPIPAQAAQSGIVERPGAAKARDVG